MEVSQYVRRGSQKWNTKLKIITPHFNSLASEELGTAYKETSGYAIINIIPSYNHIEKTGTCTHPRSCIRHSKSFTL